MSPSDYKLEKLNRNEARKLAAKIMSQNPQNVRFSRHAIEELTHDDLTTTDAINVLTSPDSRIHQDGNGRTETTATALKSPI